MDVTALATIVQNTLSGDNAVRKAAEANYGEATKNHPKETLTTMIQVVVNQGLDATIRTQAAVLVRQMCDPDGTSSPFCFGNLAAEERNQLCAAILSMLESESVKVVMNSIAQIAVKIGSNSVGDSNKGKIGGWSELIPCLVRMAQSGKDISMICGLDTITDLTSENNTQPMIIASQDVIGQAISSCFSSANLDVKVATVNLVGGMVLSLEKAAWAPLSQTTGLILAVLQECVSAQKDDHVKDMLSTLTSIAENQPEFFKQQMETAQEPCKTIYTIVINENVDEDVRKAGLEWITSFIEKRPKLIVKKMPAVIEMGIGACMKFMSEMPADESDLKEWIARMDDEEGEDDDEDVHTCGTESIDRIVYALEFDHVKNVLFSKIGECAASNSWQVKLSALDAIKQTVEYVEEEEHWTEMVKMLVNHFDHEHPRVRYAALHGLGQCANDQSPHIQEKFHSTVIPALLKKFDDPIERVASMAMSGFVSFAEELDTNLITPYNTAVMDILVKKLQTSQHRMVQEESITSIAVLATKLEKDFGKYYDSVMPMMHQVVAASTDKKQSRLRGKAFECTTLLGIAVGKDKFLPDSHIAMEQMLKVPIAPDDIQAEYIKEATERVVKCIKKDFLPMIQYVLPRIQTALDLEDESAKIAQGADTDEFFELTKADGKVVKVHNTKFEAVSQNLSLLLTIVQELESAYYDFIPQTAQSLVALLDATGEEVLFLEDAMPTALLTLAALLKAAVTGAQERNEPPTLASTMLKTIIQKTLAKIETEDDPEALAGLWEGVGECISKAGKGIVNGQELLGVVGKVYTVMEDSMKRSHLESQTTNSKKVAEPAALRDEEDEDEDAAAEAEETLRSGLTDVLGAVMLVATQEFTDSCLQDCGQRLTQWKQGGIFNATICKVAVELVKHLKGASQPIWPSFMDIVFEGVNQSKDSNLRIAAAYTLNHAARIPAFSEAAPKMITDVSRILSTEKAKKKDAEKLMAIENLVSALATLAIKFPQQCPAGVDVWTIILDKLPLREDEEEAKYVNELLADAVIAQNAALLGPNASSLGKILKLMAENYKEEDFCTKETDAKMVQIFQNIPQEKLLGLASTFTEKQQKKIEQMLSQTRSHGG